MGQQVSLLQIVFFVVLAVGVLAWAIVSGEPLGYVLASLPLLGAIWAWGFYCAWSGS
jgi:hypothetical protein